jgi:hypothetical protein
MSAGGSPNIVADDSGLKFRFADWLGSEAEMAKARGNVCFEQHGGLALSP